MSFMNASRALNESAAYLADFFSDLHYGDHGDSINNCTSMQHDPCYKGGLISETLCAKEKLLSRVNWHLCLEILAKVKKLSEIEPPLKMSGKKVIFLLVKKIVEMVYFATVLKLIKTDLFFKQRPVSRNTWNKL